MRKPYKARWVAVSFVLVLTACSPPALAVTTPTASPGVKTSPSDTPSANAPAPPHAGPSRLPGASFALAALPRGVPFTGKLLIADRGNGRIIEINAQGVVDWVFPRPGQKLPVRFGAPDDAFYT
ncbi:MAG TPA: hypothetical protein VI296_00460, partial [Candidatus Dormibacteraeota bacterium]